MARPRHHVGLAAVLAVSIVVGVCAARAERPASVHRLRTAIAGRSPAANQAAAGADAARLLAKLVLPAGARQSATEPAGGGSVLSQPVFPPTTPNLVDVRAWWRVPGSPKSVLAFVAAHPPSGGRLTLTSSGTVPPNGPPVREVSYGWPPVRTVLSSRSLGIAAVPVGGGETGVRVDAQDVWISPRPPSSRIPGSVTGLRVTVTRFGRRLQGPLRFSSAAKIRRAITLLNQLPLFQPGVRSCPPDFGSAIELGFYLRGKLRASTVVHTSGCLAVGLTIDGRRQPTLAGGWFPGSGLPSHGSLAGRLSSALGVKLQTGIPVPSSRPARHRA